MNLPGASLVLQDPVYIGIDFETFYSTKLKYSLRNMTAEEYINSELFEISMVAIKINGEPAYTYDGAHEADLRLHLLRLPWERAVVYGHNGAFFDFLILGWVFNIFPAFYMDTLLLARPLAGTGQANTLAALAERFELPPKLDTIYEMDGVRRADMSDDLYRRFSEYASWDIELCYLLLPHLLKHWRSYDIAWMDITMRMAARPMFELDAPVIEEGIRLEQEREGQQLYNLLTAMQKMEVPIPASAYAKVRRAKPEQRDIAALKKAVGSTDDFSTIMEGFGLEVPQKWSEKQQKWVPAFARSDSDFVDLADSGYFGAAELVEARLSVKSTIMFSRLNRLLGIERRLGMLPIPIMPFAAHTGRNGGCLAGHTKITVYDAKVGVVEKPITDVQDTDLVWDGFEFVTHDGVVYSGDKEVIEYDGITGTPDHIVFTERGEMPLAEAARSGTPIKDAGFCGTEWDPDCDRYRGEDTVGVQVSVRDPVYPAHYRHDARDGDVSEMHQHDSAEEAGARPGCA